MDTFVFLLCGFIKLAALTTVFTVAFPIRKNPDQIDEEIF
jgi:hypothetical protein